MTRSRPPVSIGLPVYNGGRYLAQTLDGLLRQTFEDFELIICDNASADATEEICRSYAARDRRIRYVRNRTNLGAAGNYGLAFHLSSGEYFKWSTCDDVCAPEFVARCAEVLDREPTVVLAYPRTRIINEHSEVVSDFADDLHLPSDSPGERFRQFLRCYRLSNAIYGLIRSRELKHTALLGRYIGSDVNLMAELTLHGKFWEVPDFLFYRRFHPQASSSLKEVGQLQEFYDPKTRGRIAFTEWRHHWEYFLAVKRAPLSLQERMDLYGFLVRMGIWNRANLLQELARGARRAFQRSAALRG